MKDERKRTKVKRVLKETGRQANKKLSREILLIFLISVATGLATYFFLLSMAGPIVWNYCEEKHIVLTELQQIDIDYFIQNGSLLIAVLLFLLVFLILMGRKLSYLQTILNGVDALRIHHMDYSIPIEGDNEFTELARSINYLSKTERELDEKEKQLKQERELLIRALSHDIRTPLTSIRSYSELMAGKLECGDINGEEMKEYVSLMRRKADQMKELTDQLLENSRHRPEWIEDGKFLMEQLVLEWEELLEDRFDCSIDLTECPTFAAEIDIRGFQRIFDNLYSNIEKYADEYAPVELMVGVTDDRLCIRQKNKKKKDAVYAESHQIGLLSIKSIAGNYGGSVVVKNEEETFEIQILLLEIS